MADLVDMEFTDEQRHDAPAPIAMTEKASYPYGLRICLTKEDLEKLGIEPSEDIELGGVFCGRFEARITSISANESEYGSSSRIEAQIEKMAIECDDDEDGED